MGKGRLQAIHAKNMLGLRDAWGKDMLTKFGNTNVYANANTKNGQGARRMHEERAIFCVDLAELPLAHGIDLRYFLQRVRRDLHRAQYVAHGMQAITHECVLIAMLARECDDRKLQKCCWKSFRCGALERRR